MKRLFVTAITALLAAALAGCASPSYYQAASAGSYFGYGDNQIDGPLHRINYTASASTSLDQAYAFAVYRAAELAQSKGAAYFEVLEGPINKEALERYIQKTASMAATASIRPMRYMRTQTYIYVPVAPPPPPVQISLLIRLLNAPSLDAARGFDARDILTRLSPKITRPPVKTT